MTQTNLPQSSGITIQALTVTAYNPSVQISGTATYIANWEGNFGNTSVSSYSTNLTNDLAASASWLSSTPNINTASLLVNSNYITGSFYNGGAFQMNGSGFTTSYTPTVTGFIVNTPDLWTYDFYGNITVDLRTGKESGYINQVVIDSPTGEVLSVTGMIDVNSTDASINSINYKFADGTIIADGSFTYHGLTQTITGNLTAFEYIDNANHNYQITGLSVPYLQLNSYSDLNSFVTGVMSGNDVMIGTNNSDVLRGFGGNDYIDGGNGIDTSVYSSALSNYTITKNTNGFTVTDKTGTEGTDTLTNIDRLHFSDVNVALDLNGNAGQVAKILGAVFGSGAVSNQLYVGIGLSYLDSGMSYSDLAALELNSAGALSHDAIVTRLWTNVVGSAPTAANKASYLDMLNNGMKVGDLGVLAADTGLNINNINLAGLTQTGIEYTSMAGANILTGTSGNDIIAGASGNDLIMGLSGNDIITGGGGNDVIDGGSGIDTSTYSSVRSNYTLVNNTSHFTVSSAVDGIDSLINIERLQFSDVDVALDINGNAGQVAKILGAVFGAGSVSNQQYVGIGLNYLDNGMSYSDLAALAINAAGAKTNDAIVTLLWTNVVGSAPTDVNKAPYLDMLNQGQITVGGLGVLAAETSLNINNIHLVGLAQTGLEFIHV